MELEISLVSTVVAVLLGLLTPIVWSYLAQARRYARATNIPPGPPPKPIFGNLLDPPADQRFEDWCSEQEKKYGAIMSVWLGRQLTVVVSSLEAQKEVLLRQDRDFVSRPADMPQRILSCLSKRSIFMSEYGDYWRNVRKVSSVHLLNAKKVQALASVRDSETRLFCRALAADAQRNGGLICPRPYIRRSTLNGGMQAIFSSRFAAPGFKGYDPTMAELEAAILESFALMGGLDWGHAVPLLRPLSWRYNARCRSVAAKRDRLLQTFLTQRREKMVEEGASWQPRDLADVYVSMAEKEGWSDGDILDVLLDLLNASVDTSGSSLEWLLAELTQRPEIQAKVHAELDAAVGPRLVTEEDLPQLPYLRAVVSEHFRYRQAGAFLGPHVTEEGCTLLGYTLPPQTQVLVHTLAVARDPAVWRDAEQFKPERFIEDGEVDLFGRDFRVLPFGAGRRACPGMQMGLVSVQIFLARTLQAFKWDLPVRGEPLDMTAGDWGVQVGMATPLQARITPRISLPEE